MRLHFDIGELNPRFLMWLCLGGLFVAVILYSLFIPTTANENGKNDTPIITQIEYVTVLVTPTPDGIQYFANEYQSGVRKLNHPFTWQRKNVTGNQDMRITANVYGYYMFDSIHWFNPSDYTYYEATPTSSDYVYLFVLFNIYQDTEVFDDTRLWLPKEQLMNVQIGSTLYAPNTNYPKQIRIKELENVHNLNDDSIVQAYGQYRSYDEGLDNKGTAGEISVEQYYLKGGKSNAQDGYLLFEIPKSDAKEITFNVNFYKFGSSRWRLATE